MHYMGVRGHAGMDVCSGWGDTPVSPTATQGLVATHTGAAFTVHELGTVTLPGQGLDVTHRHELGPGTRRPDPCPSPSSDAVACWCHSAWT